MVAVAYRTPCAICSNPTTNRCSRCKAVHYCSLPCQRQHWNEGHKQHCRAPEAVVAVSSGSLTNGSRNFSDVFSNSSSGSGSRALSDVSDVLRGDDIAAEEIPRSAPSNKNGILAKPKKILFPYDIFEKFFNSEGLQSSPCGLINCGNSCFANVVLQCLTYTRPLTSYLLEGIHGEECRRNDWCFMCELQDHIWRIKQNHNPVSPIRILSRIRNIGNHLGYGRQEDAHEFMRFAIDSMQSICLDEAGGEKSVDTPTQETTFIHHIFGGHLQSQVKCMRCLHESNRYENMMDLAVEIQGCVETLEDALAQFTAPELLDGENKYKCDRCNAYVKARKQLTVHEAPNILTVALKRFQSGKFGKLNKRVTFPEVLDIMPYMSGKGDKPPLYRLYAVVVHVDMLNASFFGHYICYVKDSEGLWYKIDDSKVKEVDLEKVMSQRAYMLFYRRSSARPPPVTDGAMSLQTGLQFPETNKLGSDRNGGLKVYPSSVRLLNEEAHIIHDNSEYQPQVDFNQMQADNDEISATVDEHSLSTGEVVQPQYRSWEMERILPPNNNEISAEEYSGCVSNGSSISMTSPCMSSFRSNPGLWVPSQGFVREVPNTLAAEGREVVSVDHSDFSEVSLQTGSLDKPSLAKAGKRRLEDSLCSSPTLKPLDSDPLAAWPSNEPGRSISCPPAVHVSGNQSSRIMSNDSCPVRRNHDSEKSGESLPILHGGCGDELCKAIGEEHGQEDSERSCSTALKTIGEEELVAPAKRQHVENDTRPGSMVVKYHVDKSNAVQQLSLSELGEREMDWDDSTPHAGSSRLCAASDSVMNSCVELTSTEPGKDSSVSAMQACTPDGQVILTEMAVQSLRMQADEACGNVSNFEIRSEAVVGSSCQRTVVQDSNTTSQSSSKSSNVEEASAEDMAVVFCDPNSEKPDRGYSQNPNLESLMHTTETVKNSTYIQPLQAIPSKETGNVTAGDLADAYQVALQSEMDHSLQNSLQDTNGEPDRGASKVTTTVDASPVPVLDVPSESAQRSLQKKRSSSKPLFTPGFLNKVRFPLSESMAKSRRSQTSRNATSIDVHGHSDKIEELEHNVAMSPSEAGEFSSPNGIEHMVRDGTATVTANGHASISVENPSPAAHNRQAQASVNGHALPAANLVDPNCGNCTNCELCKSAHLHGECKVAGNGVHGHQKRTSKVDTLCEDESSSKGTDAIRVGVVNGNGPTNVAVRGVTDEVSIDPVGDAVVPTSRAGSGKQKQGRNETCNCGSQRKWKKCCGKAGMIKPEPGRRRLVV